MKPSKKLLLFCLAALVLSACGNTANEPRPTDELENTEAAGTIPQSTEQGASTDMSPCDVTDQMIGQELAVAGMIDFVDHGDPNGLFVGISERGCMLGVFIDMAVFDEWDESRQAGIEDGELVSFSGVLNQFGAELVLEVITQDVGEVEPVDSEDGGQANTQLDLMGVEIEDSVLLDVPVVYSGYEGHTGLCYLGSFAMTALYHHPDLSFADIVAYSGAGTGAYVFDQMPEVGEFISNPFWEGTMVNVVDMLGASFGLGLADFGSDSDTFNPNAISFTENAADVTYLRSSGEALDFLRRVLSSGRPVVVYINAEHVADSFAEVSTFWTNSVGSAASHYMTVTGYDADFIYLNDPTEPNGEAKNLTAPIEDFILAWEDTLTEELPPLGPFWMLYLIDTGAPASIERVLSWNAEVAAGSVDHLWSFSESPSDSEFSCFSYREIARGRLEFADYLAQNGLDDLAELYRQSGEIFGSIGLQPDNLISQLINSAEMEEAALQQLMGTD